MEEVSLSEGQSALAGARQAVRRIPLENISSLATGSRGRPDLIALWFGEGDLAAPAFIGEAMRQAVVDGHVFYAPQNGIPELRQALASYLTGLGAGPVKPERITVTTSAMHGLMMAVHLIAERGDNVVVVDPLWPNIGGAARLAGVEARSVRMDHGPGGWSLDPGKVAAAMDGRTRGVFFASPGNPTGAMIPIEIQRALLAITRSRGAWLIADEVYNRLVFGARAAPSILGHAEPEDRVLVVNSFSKSWAMTGWRLGWIVHPASLGPTLAMMVQYTTSGVTTFLQHAGVAAVQDGEDFVAQVRAYCERGMEIVCAALEGAGRVRLGPRPAAGMYAFFEVDGMTDSRAVCLEILRRTRVGVAPGRFFGPGSEGFLRICVARAPEALAEAMARLATIFA